jgi:transposase-like protein
MKLKEAAKKVEDSVEETLSYTAFPFEHWTRIRTNNVIELTKGCRYIHKFISQSK